MGLPSRPLGEWMGGPDSEESQRGTDAMLKMAWTLVADQKKS